MKKLSETYKELGVEFTFPIEIRNSDGNMTYDEDSNGYWRKQEYNADGKQTYYESSGGYWCKIEYDSNGNQTYFEVSNGYWYKKEYDSKGNVTYIEDSDGYWCKKEYDSDGNETYCEDSDGDKRGTPRRGYEAGYSEGYATAVAAMQETYEPLLKATAKDIERLDWVIDSGFLTHRIRQSGATPTREDIDKQMQES